MKDGGEEGCEEEGTGGGEQERANLYVSPRSRTGRHLIQWKRIIIRAIYQMPI